MAINATALPALFASSTWQPGGYFDAGSGNQLLASVDGSWVTTFDGDGVHVEQADFDAIEGATAHPDNDGALLVAGAKKYVAARVVNGVRWAFLADPE